MKDTREYLLTEENGIPVWVKNPAYTGNKFSPVFKRFPCRLLKKVCGLPKGTACTVYRIPSGELYLSDLDGFSSCTEAIEGVHFELIGMA